MDASTNTRGRRLIVGISGASGSTLAVRFLSTAARHESVERIHVVVSNSALRVSASELDPPASTPAAIIERCKLPHEAAAKIEHHPNADIGALIASGSYRCDGMVVIPCSSGTLASIAHGISRDLMQRAADLMLKERRPLLLALRETPLSLIHAENIVAVTRAGAIVIPPVPAFYSAQTLDDFADHFVMRCLDLLGLDGQRDDLRWHGGR